MNRFIVKPAAGQGSGEFNPCELTNAVSLFCLFMFAFFDTGAESVSVSSHASGRFIIPIFLISTCLIYPCVPMRSPYGTPRL